jgi:peptidoglycan/xylan/chitin deacetylase (PgdA/CDA1 family)
MRLFVFFVCCLVGGIASGFAQSNSSSEQSPAATPAAAPVTQPASSATAKPVEHAAAKPAEPPGDDLAAKSAEPPAAKPSEQQAATPPEQKSEQPAEQHAAIPADTAEPAATATITPADKPPEQPVAKPDEQPEKKTDVKKAEKPAEAGCPGHPDALGTSRVLTITPDEFKLLGTIQYKQTLPLKDHEVVLTFDDGPIPPYSNSILDTLASQCVKATYFMVGEMARHYPYLVRRVYNEGHSIGTHTEHHPLAMQRLSIQRVASEVNVGIASVDGALGDPRALSPFFRIPGLGRTNAIEHFLESKNLVTWSADVDTNDWWRGTTPGALIQRAMRRLNAKGRGIILMHDIHPATALALPALLKELKNNGYHVVHVVAAGEQPKSLPEVVATPIEKEAWPRMMHAKAEKADAAKTEPRSRVKTVIAKRHHRRVAKLRNTSKIIYAADAIYKPGRGNY